MNFDAICLSRFYSASIPFSDFLYNAWWYVSADDFFSGVETEDPFTIFVCGSCELKVAVDSDAEDLPEVMA